MLVTDSQIAAKLAEVAGPEAVTPGDGAAHRAVCGIVPRVVVRPSTPEAVAAVLALATREGWRVEPAGAGTCLDWGRPPERVDVLLSTSALAEVREYSPGDLVVGVDAGAPLAAVQARLAQQRQWLPWDPPAAPGATIGAILAHAAAGPLRLGYGTPRDHVLGLRFATGDGRLLRVGGRVVKNVAGYDIGKLIVGSRGTLAVVVGAFLRLRGLPEADVTVRVAAEEPAPLLEIARTLPGTALPPVALELLSPALASRVGVGNEWTLLVRFHGSTEAVGAATEAASRAAGGAAAVLEGAGGAGAWTRLGEVEAAAAAVVRVANRPATLGATLAAAEALGAAFEPEGPLLAAHAGDGIVRVLAMDARPVAGEVRAARERVAAAGGTVLVARGRIGDVDPYPAEGPALRLMHGLRRVFDPAGVLSPGRFL